MLGTSKGISREVDGGTATGEKLVAFAKETSFAVTAEEIKAFFTEMSEEREGELSDSELDAVAGGKGLTTGIFYSVFTAGIMCAVISIKDGNCSDDLSVPIV